MKLAGLEDGYTVIEMLIVMIILGVVMGGVIAIFVSLLATVACKKQDDEKTAQADGMMRSHGSPYFLIGNNPRLPQRRVSASSEK